MIVHALVEGPSDKAFLERWAKRLLPGHELRAYPHQGKGKLSGGRPGPRRRGLLDQLPAKLAAYGQSLDPDEARVLVLIDADDDDIRGLAERLESLLGSLNPAPRVFFAFAVEELEAFYLGDLAALQRAFPDFDRARAQAYVPDSICGTWELFGKIVGDAGGNKVAWAEAMGDRLTTRCGNSRSPSFREVCTGLRDLVIVARPAPPRRRKPRRAKRAVPRDSTGKRKW